MSQKLFLTIIFCKLLLLSRAQENRIVYEGTVPKEYKGDSITLKFTSIYVALKEKPIKYTLPITDGRFKCVMLSDSAVVSYGAYSSDDNKHRGYFLFEPGDSIVVDLINDRPEFHGRGAEKFELAYTIFNDPRYNNNANVPQHIYQDSNRLTKYLHIISIYDSVAERRDALIEEYKDKISSFAYSILQAEMMSFGEHNRNNHFWELVEERNRLNLSSADLVRIYDSTLANSPVTKIPKNDTTALSSFFSFYFYRVNPLFAYGRSLFFDERFFDRDPNRDYNIYMYSKNTYKGLLLEKSLLWVLSGYMLRKGGQTSDFFSCYDDFQRGPYRGIAKAYIKNQLEKYTKLDKNSAAPNFKLVDQNGDTVRLSDFLGKLIVLDFWFTGCKGCVQMSASLRKVEEEFSQNPNIVFISVSVDKDKTRWIKSIKQAKYVAGKGINLYTEGKGTEHDIVSSYDVTSFPRIFVIDNEGEIARYPAPDPRDGNGDEFKYLLSHELAMAQDGPYIYSKNDRLIAKSISVSKGSPKMDSVSYAFVKRNRLVFDVNSDVLDRPFKVVLKKDYKVEPSTFKQPDKMFVVSDIEGNFDALRKLLQVHGIIDSSLHWIYGDGHLILNGDIVDRGSQVTECLWLIYTLEEQAKNAGGYVHFILGNHELLNLSGNLKYVNKKYKQYCQIMNEEYSSLYSNQSELGKWIRTKNVVEKIGDVLFAHAGISQEMNNQNLSVEEINGIARRYYGVHTNVYPDAHDNIIMSGEIGPFWYRGYYEKKDSDRASVSQIDSTLTMYKVKAIVTGHTIVGDTVSVHYEGRVFNTDTKHAKGESEALYIESGSFYRVNISDKKKYLLYSFAMKTKSRRQYTV